MTRRASLVLIACLLAVAIPVLAQSSPNYNLSWYVVAGGSGRMESAGHTLLSTVGQPEAGALASDNYTVGGGFWPGGAPAIYRVYLPLVLSQYP